MQYQAHYTLWPGLPTLGPACLVSKDVEQCNIDSTGSPEVDIEYDKAGYGADA